VKTIAHTLELVPAQRPHDEGLTYLFALSTVVPNIFGDVHPAKLRGTPGDWLIQQIDPAVARTGGSIGYSCIAEAYLNFGWWGTPVFLFVVGLVLATISIWGERSDNPINVALVACVLNSLSHYARGDFYSVARPIVWTCILPFLACKQVERFNRHAL
jgi:oligosaccharide repeat unit polymerase